MLASQARQVVLGPVLTHLTLDLLQRTQAIEERMFLAGESMVAVGLLRPEPGPGLERLAEGGGEVVVVVEGVVRAAEDEGEEDDERCCSAG